MVLLIFLTTPIPVGKAAEVARDIMLYANKYTQNLPLSEQTRRGKAVVQLFSDAIKSIESEKTITRAELKTLIIFKLKMNIMLPMNILNITTILSI